MNLIYILFIFISFGLGLVSCSSDKKSSSSKQKYTINQNQIYSLSNQILDTYIPDSGSNLPVVVVVHGGGWKEGSKSDLGAYAASFAENGIAAVAINYRLSPTFTFPDAFDDVSSAVTWVKANSTELRIDPNKVFLMGYSAGGNLSLLAGLHADNDVLGIISAAGPTDLENLMNSQALADATSYMGGTALSFGSPINLVSTGDPEVLMLHGATDTLVFPAQSNDLSVALTSAGVNNQVISYPGVGHEILYAPEAGSMAAAEMLSFVNSLSGL